MLNKCYYSIVRYVPSDVRDEAVNVGVIIEAESIEGRCLTAFTSSFGRAANIDPNLELRTVEQLVRRFQERISEQCRHYQLSELFRHYVGGRLQLTEPRFSLAADVHVELEQLKHQFVVDVETHRQLGFTEKRLVVDVREELKRQLGNFPQGSIRFSGRAHPVTFQGKSGSHGFDIVFSSPLETNLVRCITFDVKGYTEKVNEAKILAFDFDDILKAERKKKIDVLSVLYPPQNSLNGNQQAFYSAEEILLGHRIATFDFSKPADRKRLVDIARTRVAEATLPSV